MFVGPGDYVCEPLQLAISRRIIEAHGGRLWATANVPQGAVVQFTVPLGSEGVA